MSFVFKMMKCVSDLDLRRTFQAVDADDGGQIDGSEFAGWLISLAAEEALASECVVIHTTDDSPLTMMILPSKMRILGRPQAGPAAAESKAGTSELHERDSRRVCGAGEYLRLENTLRQIRR